MKTLSKATAARVWHAHREIEAAEKLREETLELISLRSPNPAETWAHHLQLSIPRSESESRLLRVEAHLAIHVIDAHIINQQKELVEASIAAALELSPNFVQCVKNLPGEKP